MEQAVGKLKTEMEGSKNPYVKVIGKFLLQVLETNPAAVEKILSEGKTILGGIKSIESLAKKNQHDGMCMVADSEGYAIVLKYYGIKGQPVESIPATVVTSVATPKTHARFNISLDDLL